MFNVDDNDKHSINIIKFCDLRDLPTIYLELVQVNDWTLGTPSALFDRGHLSI